MQRVLLYGKSDKLNPWSDGFEIQADGSINFNISGVNQLQIQEDKDINWIDLLGSELDNFSTPEERRYVEYSSNGYPLAIYEHYRNNLWNKLEKYCNQKSIAERSFYNLYCRLCCHDIHDGAFLPALIPNVYVSWIFSKQERVKEQKKKPFIVDFVFKSSLFGTNDIVIVEIDGPSHYATYNNFHSKYEVSEQVYAEHLKKDRWLRRQGVKVFRIGNSEIKSIMSLPEELRLRQFYHFFNEVFGKVFSVEI